MVSYQLNKLISYRKMSDNRLPVFETITNQWYHDTNPENTARLPVFQQITKKRKFSELNPEATPYTPNLSKNQKDMIRFGK